MRVRHWLETIRKDLNEEVKILVYDEEGILGVFLEEFLDPSERVIYVNKNSFLDELAKVIHESFQVFLLVESAFEEVYKIVTKFREHDREAKIFVILSFLKEGDIGRYFELGVDEVMFKPFTINELEARLSKVLKEYYLDQKLKRLLVEDSLTGVYNRRFFEERLSEEVYKALRQNYPLCLLMIDVDNFKWYNDNYGHKEGDKLLKLIGQVLKGSVREKIDLVCRYGGDEFAVILPHVNREQALVIKNRILRNWEKKGVEGITLSIGVAQLRSSVDAKKSIEDLISTADQNMYETKKKQKTKPT